MPCVYISHKQFADQIEWCFTYKVQIVVLCTCKDVALKQSEIKSGQCTGHIFCQIFHYTLKNCCGPMYTHIHLWHVKFDCVQEPPLTQLIG